MNRVISVKRCSGNNLLFNNNYSNTSSSILLLTRSYSKNKKAVKQSKEARLSFVIQNWLYTDPEAQNIIKNGTDKSPPEHQIDLIQRMFRARADAINDTHWTQSRSKTFQQIFMILSSYFPSRISP